MTKEVKHYVGHCSICGEPMPVFAEEKPSDCAVFTHSKCKEMAKENKPKDKCTLSNTELIKKCRRIISEVSEKGRKAWTMNVPPEPNLDSDYILTEIVDRFETLGTEHSTSEDPTCTTCKQYLGSQAPTYTCAALKLYVEPEDETCAMYRNIEDINNGKI